MIRITTDDVLSWVLKLNGFQSRSTQIGSARIHHLEKRAQNEKGILVFVHGIGANAGHFAQVLPRIHREGYSVFAPDLPGHGKSTDPEERMTSDVFYGIFSRWLDQVPKAPFVLVGNSLGGALSLKYSIENPGRVEKLILISPAGGFESEREWETFKSGLQFQSVEDSKKFVPKIYHRPPFYLPLTYGTFLKNMQRPGLRDMIDNTGFDTFQLDPAQYTVLPPTLFIWGKSEKLFPISHLDKFKRDLPSQVVFEEPGDIGHCPQLESPQWLASKVGEFIESSRVASA